MNTTTEARKSKSNDQYVSHLNLTQAQQLSTISLFQSGMTKYTEISKELKLPYAAINKYMTKWKRKQGILKSKSNKKARIRVIQQDQPSLVSQAVRAGNKAIDSVLEDLELKFLRNFYANAVAAEIRH